MKRLTILTLFLILAACGSLQQQQANIVTLHASLDQLFMGKVGLPDFTLADLQNAKTDYEAHFAATSNPYDKAGVQCMAAWITYLPAIQSAFAPPASAPQAAPVTGFFSAIAARQIAAEDAQVRLAAKEALIRKGFPPEVSIACAPLTDVIGRALSHGGTR